MPIHGWSRSNGVGECITDTDYRDSLMKYLRPLTRPERCRIKKKKTYIASVCFERRERVTRKPNWNYKKSMACDYGRSMNEQKLVYENPRHAGRRDNQKS
jgi:hypothetical protein